MNIGGIFNGLTGSSINSSDLFGTKQGTVPYTNTSSPWAPVQPYLTFGFGQAQNLYNQSQPFVQQASDLQRQRALDPNGLTAQAQHQLSSTINGDYLNPNTNPYLASSVNDALGLAKSQFAGMYGGPAGQNVNNSGFQENLARGLGQIATSAYSNAYGQERQNQLNAISAAPGIDQANVGALYQAASAPFMNLGSYTQALTPGLGFGTTQGQQPYFQNNTATTLGALAGAGGLIKAFG